MQELESKIGYKFKDIKLLELALTHSSCSCEVNNEKLEFLGDRILGFVIAEILYIRYSCKNEGYFSKFLSYLTSKEILLEVAYRIGICNFIKKQHCLEQSIEGNAIEAIIAAIYLDSSNMVAIKDFINNYWDCYITKYLEEDYYVQFNPKSYIQEWAQKNKLDVPVYHDLEKQGSDHQPIFLVEILISGYKPVKGKGISKKQAQKDASINFIKKYRINEKNNK